MGKDRWGCGKIQHWFLVKKKVLSGGNPKFGTEKLLIKNSEECRARRFVLRLLTNLFSVQGYRSLGRKGLPPVAEVRSSGCPGTIAKSYRHGRKIR
jgi:hypothetical protein